MKDVYLTFVNEIQWDKDTKKFDILLYFDETNIAEYLGIKPQPDPDSQLRNQDTKNISTQENHLIEGCFYVVRLSYGL